MRNPAAFCATLRRFILNVPNDRGFPALHAGVFCAAPSALRANVTELLSIPLLQTTGVALRKRVDLYDGMRDRMTSRSEGPIVNRPGRQAGIK